MVDPRQEPAHFTILRHTPKGYVVTRKQAGWVKSQVLGKAFRLTQRKDEAGYTEYNLAVR